MTFRKQHALADGRMRLARRGPAGNHRIGQIRRNGVALGGTCFHRFGVELQVRERARERIERGKRVFRAVHDLRLRFLKVAVIR